MTGEFRDQMVLIGDLYNWDVVGAKQAGWKAVWYNPRHEPCPGCLPFHDIEIDAMGQLPAALDEPLCLKFTPVCSGYKRMAPLPTS